MSPSCWVNPHKKAQRDKVWGTERTNSIISWLDKKGLMRDWGRIYWNSCRVWEIRRSRKAIFINDNVDSIWMYLISFVLNYIVVFVRVDRIQHSLETKIWESKICDYGNMCLNSKTREFFYKTSWLSIARNCLPVFLGGLIAPAVVTGCLTTKHGVMVVKSVKSSRGPSDMGSGLDVRVFVPQLSRLSVSKWFMNRCKPSEES